MSEFSYVVTTQLNDRKHSVVMATDDLLSAIETQRHLLNERRMLLGVVDFAEFLKNVEEFQSKDNEDRLEFHCIECYSGRDIYTITITRTEYKSSRKEEDLKVSNNLKENVHSRVAKLEEDIYGHSDNAEEITEQIMEIAEVSGVKEESVKEAIANKAILLLENHRFGE